MTHISKFFLMLGVFYFAGCDQAPIFWTIANEDAPKDPLISGTPSKIVKDKDGNLYTANGDLWKFNGSSWDLAAGSSTFGGEVRDVAATQDAVYVLTFDLKYQGSNTKISQYGGSWFIGGSNLDYQAIFADSGDADKRLFISKRVGDNTTTGSIAEYSISVVKGGTETTIASSTGLLTGVVKVANNKYYLATTGKGVLICDTTNTTPDITQLPNVVGCIFGIMGTDPTAAYPTYVAAAEKAGTVYQIKVSDDSVSSVTTVTTVRSYYTTGALATWCDVANGITTPELLLVGVRNGTFYGYVEINLSTDQSTAGAFTGGTFNTPGYPDARRPTTMPGEENRAKYTTSIEKHPVNSLMQAPGSPLVFASTQQNGLWSLRYDAWNAEE